MFGLQGSEAFRYADADHRYPGSGAAEQLCFTGGNLAAADHQTGLLFKI